MKKLSTAALLASILLLAGCASTEHSLTNWAFRIERVRADLELKQVQVEDFTIPYLEGGQGETIFLIHGFQSNKDIWVRFAGQLTNQYHVVVMDLPAHGDSNIRMDKRYTVPEQARIVAATMEKLQLTKPVHVVGHSMGGAIAANLSATAPQRVKTLVLMNAAGVEAPQPSGLMRALEKGKNPLIVRNKDDYEAMLAFTMSDPPYIPFPMVNQLTREAVAREPIATHIFADLRSPDNPRAQDILPRVKVPVLVLWGDEDQVIDVSSTDVFCKWLPRCEVVILKGVGHAPQIERTNDTVQAYRTFLAKASK